MGAQVNSGSAVHLGVIAIVNVVLIAVAFFFLTTTSCVVEEKAEEMNDDTFAGDNMIYQDAADDDDDDEYETWDLEGYLEPITSDKYNFVLERGHYKLFPEDEDFDSNYECGKAGKSLERIVGGVDAPYDTWPWIVQVVPGTSPASCGGALVTPRHTMTAAHCVQTTGQYNVIAKHKNYMRNPYSDPRFKVLYVRFHPLYDKNQQHLDHALLTHEKIEFTEHTVPACLPLSNKLMKDMKEMWVAGWGTMVSGGATGLPTNLKHVKVDVKSCAEFQFPRNMIICGSSPGKDSCQGDSGGPYGNYYEGRYYNFGIVSFGIGCAAETPGAYAEVAPLMNWFCCYMKKAPQCENVLCDWQGEPKMPVILREQNSGNAGTGSTGSGGSAGGGTGSGGSNTGSGGGSSGSGGDSTGSGETTTGSGGDGDSEEVYGGTGTIFGTVELSPNSSPGTNDLEMCIGELQTMKAGWYLEGTPKPNQASVHQIDYVILEVPEKGSRSFQFESRSLKYKSRFNIQADSTDGCPCGQMHQQYFDYAKEHDIYHYNNVWWQKISGQLTPNPDIC